MLGVGEDGYSYCPSTILGLGRPHPHPGCTRASWNSGARPGRGAVRTRLGQRVPCTPSPRSRRGRSLFLRISGLCCRVPCKPASAGAALRTLGGGRGGRQRPNHKASSPAGQGHSHKIDYLSAGEKWVFAPRSILKDLKAAPNNSC